MTPSLHTFLHRFATRALEPGDRQELADRLKGSPRLQEALADIESRLPRGEAGGWRSPPPGLPPLPGRARPLALALQEASLHGEEPRIGDRVVLSVAAGEPSSRPLLVREAAGEVQVIHPLSPEDWPSLSAFRKGPEGHELDLVLASPPGPHRYLLALVPQEMTVEWSASAGERWQNVREAIEEGRIPSSITHLEVKDFG